MRVTTDLFVAALTRRIFSGGGFAAVERRGAAEAGACFIVERGRDGTVILYGPAPQTSYGEDGRPTDRRFAVLAEGDDDKARARLEREARFDPDLWVVEVEPGATPLSEIIALDA